MNNFVLPMEETLHFFENLLCKAEKNYSLAQKRGADREALDIKKKMLHYTRALEALKGVSV